MEQYITIFDLKRLDSYARNLVDFHLIMDLVPTLAKLFFLVLPRGAITLSYVQSATLAGMGLQFKTIDQLTVDLGLQANQLLPLFNKAMRKFAKLIKEVFEYDIAQEMNRTEQKTRKVLSGVAGNVSAASTLGQQTLHEELLAGTNLSAKMQVEKDKFISQHKIKKSASDALETAAANSKKGLGVVSIPRKRSDKNDSDEGDEIAAIE